MELANLLDATEDLEECFPLVVRAVGRGADFKRLLPYLMRAMRSDQDTALNSLRALPFPLRNFASREEARKHQLALGSLECVATIESGWKLGDWVLPETAPRAVARLIARAVDSNRSVVYALLRASHPVPEWILAAACRAGDGIEATVLSNTDVLVACPPANAKGSLPWLQRVRRALRDRLPSAPDLYSAVAVCPEDGESLPDLLTVLDERVSRVGAEVAERADRFDAPQPHWPLGGAAWRQVIETGLPEGEPDRDLISASAWCAQHWPGLYEGEGQAEEERRERLRSAVLNYTLKREQRARVREDLLAGIRTLKQLPSLPASAMQAHQLAQSPDSNANALADFISRDPGLSTRILSVVNSPYFGLRAQIDSIRHALVLLGWQEIAHLAILVSSESVFRELNPRQGQVLWQHSARCADIARLLAERVPQVSVARLYTAALLHDVGKVCLLGLAAEDVADCARWAEQHDLPAHQAERELLGLDHAEIGGMLLRHWGLPESVSQSVELHHGPLPGQNTLPLEAALVALADELAHRLGPQPAPGSSLRLSACQLAALEPALGPMSVEAVELIAADLKQALRNVPTG